MAESDFMTAFNKRYSEGGFDPQYQRNVAKRVATLSEKAKGVASKKRPQLRKSGMGSFDPETGSRASKEQLETEKQFRDYDTMREELAGFLAGNVYDRGKKPNMEQARKIVDDFAKAQREQQYAAPATSTPESPVPSARTTPDQRATADVKAGDVKIEGLGYQKNAPEMSEAESTGYAKLESSMSPEGVEIGNKPAPSVKLESSMFPEGVEVAATSPSTATAEAPTKAAPVELDENRMAQLYRKTTGSVYNPEVSKAAREKMAQLKAFVSSNPDMLNKSDTKIALDFYRTLK